MVEDLDAIFWDFDGVLMNSNAVRDIGFERVLSAYPQEQVAALMEFHRANGGLSRYVKFRFFFEKIRGEKISDEEIQMWAAKFSAIMMSMLLDRALLIEETTRFVMNNFSRVPMHVVSGSDQSELRLICDKLGLAPYFKSINGSPTTKYELLVSLLEKNKFRPAHCLMIGDSINDFDAARAAGVQFMAYNNPSLVQYTSRELKLSRE